VSLLVNRLMASRTGAIGVDIDGHQQSIDSVSDHHLTGGQGRLGERPVAGTLIAISQPTLLRLR
jgi:hypothetical protein